MEPVRTLAIPTIPQAIFTLYQALVMAQRAGIYSLEDANQIGIALHALRFRLHLDQNMRPLALSQVASGQGASGPGASGSGSATSQSNLRGSISLVDGREFSDSDSDAD